ncbi:MAG: glycosyltransferase [Ruthenibacterium sp.]
MSIKDDVWRIAKPVARVLLPHWHASGCALSPAEAQAAVCASSYLPHTLYSTDDSSVQFSPLVPDALDLSVVVPVYNAEAFLEKCIGSLATQYTQYRFEIIVVNDGSTDRSAEILTALSQKYTRLKIITQENQGISAARNTGIACACGHYLSFVDNDDFVAPWFIDTLLTKAKSESADIVKCGYRIFDETMHGVVGQIQNEDAVLCGEMGVQAARYNGFVWGCMFRRSLFADIRFPDGFWYEDMITRMLLMRKCRCFVSLHAALYTHTEHSGNASKTIWNSSEIKCLDQCFLPAALAHYGECIGLGCDNGLYPVLLEEFGIQLRTRTSELPDSLRKAAFVLACQCLDTYRPQNTSPLTEQETLLDDAFANRNEWKWALCCLL